MQLAFAEENVLIKSADLDSVLLDQCETVLQLVSVHNVLSGAVLVFSTHKFLLIHFFNQSLTFGLHSFKFTNNFFFDVFCCIGIIICYAVQSFYVT